MEKKMENEMESLVPLKGYMGILKKYTFGQDMGKKGCE